MNYRIKAEESGQALLELSLAFTMFAIVVFGIVDFGRAIYEVEVLKNLTGEGSSLASRGTTPSSTAQTLTAYAASTVDLANQGCVIVTVVTNNSGSLQITDQASQCAIAAVSKVGCLQGASGCQSSSPVLPSEASSALQGEVSGSSMYVTEIYYSYNTSTPITSLLQGGALPSQLYSVSYY
jgi:Flp pilus assembly protein TadG